VRWAQGGADIGVVVMGRWRDSGLLTRKSDRKSSGWCWSYNINVLCVVCAKGVYLLKEERAGRGR
jgi:hypothetical protein